MKGIHYVVDEAGERRAVQIDLDVWGELWENFYDQALAQERESEPRESLEDVKRRLNRRSA